MEWQGRSGVTLCHPSLTSAGKAILTKAIRRAGWSTEQFSICQPHDIPANARAIVALGDPAQEALTGWFGGKRSVKYTRGYLLQGFSGLPVVPTFDPTQLAQGQMKLLGLLMNDIGVALQAAVGARKVCLDPKTVTNYRVGLDALRELYAEAVADPNLLVAFDLETATSWGEDEDESIEFSRDAEDESEERLEGGSDSDSGSVQLDQSRSLSRDALSIDRAGIRTVQFSLRPGTGVSCDWSDECRDWVQRIVSLPNPLAGHNVNLFDFPILERHGIVFNGGGPLHDTMWMWHHLQPDLPAHLQGVSSLYGMPFPWKHLSGADLDFYGAADVDAVQRIMLGLPVALKRLGLWDGYERYVRQFRPVLSAMERRGIPVSREKLEELRNWLTQEVERMDSELQPMIPAELKGRKVWKSWPADTKPLVEEYKQGEIAQIKSALEADGKKVTKKALTLVVKPGDLPEPHRSIISEELGYQWDGDHLYKTLDFNPRSSDQILQFIRAKGYPVPKRFKDQKDTTSDKELERLEVKTKDPVISLVRSIRAYSKMGNAYAGKLLEDGTVEGGWQPGPDGRLRSTVTFGPGTGQLAARNPNTMTCFSPDTEILTKRGWIRFDELGGQTEVAQFNSDTQVITFVKPTQLIYQQATDGLVSITTPTYINMLVTPDHECLLQKWTSNTFIKVPALRYPRFHRQLGAGFYRAGKINRTPAQVTLIAALQADGSVRSGRDGAIVFSLKKKRKQDRLEKALLNEGINFSLQKGRPEYKTYYISGKDVPEWLQDKKFYGPWILDLDQESLDLLASEIFLWDGSRKRRAGKFSTVDEVNAIWVQILFTLTGRRSFMRIDNSCRDGRQVLYEVGSSYKNYSKTNTRTIERIPYYGYVYCVTVPEGNVVTRYQGSVSITGNCPKRRPELASKFRQCIVAESGYKLVELDYTAFHARTLGLAAQDAAYMKLAAMDIHSFVAGHMIKYPGIEAALTLSDSDLKQLLEEIKSKHKNVRNFKAKPAILGIGFKMGKRRLYYENRDSYESEAEAGKLISLLHELFPNVFKWQDAICEKADKDGRLINSWGACRWFWDVMKWTRRDGQWVKSTGRDAEKATAYLPSSNAHFMLRDKLLQANAKGWLEQYGLTNCIHDAVLFHCPTSLVDECVHNIKALMEAPVQQMADPKVAPDGFTCGVEAMVGSDWSNMEEVH